MAVLKKNNFIYKSKEPVQRPLFANYVSEEPETQNLKYFLVFISFLANAVRYLGK